MTPTTCSCSARGGLRSSPTRDDGTKLWEETGGQGVDDVWAADLDGDGIDEVIVGYNGSTGLHVFSADGKRLWKRTDMGNVWHVTAGDLDGDGKPEVVTTSARGKVHVFSPGDGKPLRSSTPACTPTWSAPRRAVDPLIEGRSGARDRLRAVGRDDGGAGRRRQDALDDETLCRRSHCDSLTVSPDGTQAAVGLRGGQVCVVDIGRGRIVALVQAKA